ncbi:MAG: hypothetical protein EA427_16440 [Spirochaetaceae bacterium]|nr:MAG: hypothetical protein EA427_16440 [Spirochaetaceae bacterium]
MTVRSFARTLIALGLILTPVATLHSQAIAQVVLLPQTFFVGDMVEARVVVRTTETLSLTVPDPLPVTEWITIHSLTIVQRADGFEARIVFQPFFVGTRQLPVIGLGAMELSGVSVFVSSLVEAGDLDPAPIRDQMILPGTRFLIALLVAMVVFVPLLVLGTGKWIRRWIRYLVGRWRENRPYRRLMKNLKVLQAEMNQVDGKRYYIRLLDEARTFFHRHFHASILAATTEELEGRLEEAKAPAEIRRGLVEMFRFGDLVKFAQQTVTLEDRTRHLDELRRLAQMAYRNRKQSDRSRVDVGS